VDGFEVGENDFQFVDYKVTEFIPFVNWKPNTWHPKSRNASGKLLTLTFSSPLPDFLGLEVNVHYELYDGIPLMVKWVSLENKSKTTHKIDRVVNEILGLVEEESAVVGSPEQMKKQHGIYVETNYAFNNAMRYAISDQTIHWKIDSLYTSQVNYNYQTPCVLEVYPEKAIGTLMKANKQHTALSKCNQLVR